MVKPCQVEPLGPPLSAKGPFVKFDPADSKLSGNNHKKPLDNYYIDLSYFSPQTSSIIKIKDQPEHQAVKTTIPPGQLGNIFHTNKSFYG